MHISDAYLYSEDIITGNTKKHSSLKKACEYMYNLPHNKKDVILLCIGNRNLDYIHINETVEQYYKRMINMIRNI